VTHLLLTAHYCQDDSYGMYGQSCPVGRYDSESGCQLCPPGKISFGNSTSCDDCPAGKFSDTTGSSVCFDCPKHYFVETTGATVCQECPTFTYTTSSGSSSAQTCITQLCPQGSKFYSTLGGFQFVESQRRGPSRFFNALTDCRSQYHGGQVLNLIDNQGLSNFTGSFLGVDSVWIGTYVLGTKLFNINSSLPSSAITLAGAAYTNETYGAVLVMSSSKTVSRKQDKDLFYYYCQVSQYYCSINTSCPTGMFLDRGNAPFQCQFCPAGKYTIQANMTQCLACNAGTYSNSGATVCINCTSGKFSSSISSGVCSNCSSGYYSSSGATFCTVCSGGFYQSLLGQSNCLSCSPGSYSISAASVCSTCLGGYYSTSTTCLECQAGTYSLDSSVSCNNCPRGTYSDATWTMCKLCGVGTISGNQGSRTCSPCAAGLFQNVTGLSFCYECSAGTFSQSGAGDCSSCSPGFISFNGASSCSACAAGRFQNVSRQSSCGKCLSGSFSNSGESTCTSCTAGKYSFDNASTCSNCQGGFFQPYSNQSSCSICQTGEFSLQGSTSCLICPPGTISLQAASSCQLCSLGRFQLSAGQSSCLLCPLGKYQSSSGASLCVDCTEFSYSDMLGSSACSPCPLGSQNVAQGSVALQDCKVCSENYYGFPQKQVACKQCFESAGVSCPLNSTLPLVAPGFYRLTDDFTIAYACQPASSCVATGVSEYTQCATGYSGFACGGCDDNFYKFNSECRNCPGEALKWLTILAAAFIVLGLLFRISSQQSEIPVDIRIVLQAIQLIALYPNITAKWPPYLLSIIQYLSLSVAFCFKSKSLIFSVFRI
jgi:hypothetical protein